MPEILIGIGLIGIIALFVASVYFAHFRLFSNQVTIIDVATQNKIALDEMTNEIRESQQVAARIASCEIERLRKLDFASLPSTGIVDPPCNADLSKLPDPKSATRTINDYLLDPDVKQVSIQVTWTESNVGKDVKIETLISKYGL